jgi:hypothetical protein
MAHGGRALGGCARAGDGLLSGGGSWRSAAGGSLAGVDSAAGQGRGRLGAGLSRCKRRVGPAAGAGRDKGEQGRGRAARRNWARAGAKLAGRVRAAWCVAGAS